MVGGQWLDLEAEGRTLDPGRAPRGPPGQDGRAHRGRRARRRARGRRGALASSRPLRAYGEEVGLAFQIADDVLDATATTEELGKTAGRDAARGQVHLRALLGVAGAQAAAAALAEAAVHSLERRGCHRGHSRHSPAIL